MKKKLIEVLILGKAMDCLESQKLQFTPAGEIRYTRARNAVRVHRESFQKQVQEAYEKEGVQSREAFQKAHDTVLEAINGEEVELQLPPPIPVEWILELPTPSAAEHDAIAVLTDVVLGTPDS